MVKVAIADAHPVIRCGVRSVLESANGFVIVGESFDGLSTIDLVRSVDADILTLGMLMPGIHGIELIRQIKNERPSLRILILTSYTEEVYAIGAFKAGASGFLTKTASGADLLAAVEKLASGGVFVGLRMAEHLAQTLMVSTPVFPHEKLTSREFDVFVRIASGETTISIARALSLSTRTISTHQAHIFEKTELPHRAAMVRYAIRHRLIDADEGV
jgi:DNA-binding NarL/FixJ family response regulator